MAELSDVLASWLSVGRAATKQAVPVVNRVVRSLSEVVEQASEKIAGDDLKSRMEIIRQRYEAAGGDPFGMDVTKSRVPALIMEWLHRLYFRTQVTGLENVPKGRVLLISNHSGQLPLDGAMIVAAMLLDADPPRLVRSMVEKWVPTLPFLSTFFARVGQVVGVPENARLLLEREEIVLAFPEGVRGISKPFTRRYELERFGRGFMRLALQTHAPIVPVAVVGAEEQYINVGNLDSLAKLIGVPVIPILPQLLLPGGQLPLPTKYHIRFGEPQRFDGDPEDDVRVSENVWVVRQTIQNMLREGLRDRQGIFR